MNAPAKVAAPDKSLDDLHAERTALLEQKARLAELRDKDTSGTELEEAAEAIEQYTKRESERLEKWFDDGCVGERPSADFRELQRLETRKLKAITALEHAKSARAALDAREAECDRELGRLAGEIESEAARLLAQDMGELGTRAAELRKQLDEIGVQLLAARTYFGDLAQRSYDDSGVRNVSYDVARRASTHGLQHIPSVDQAAFTASAFPFADREQVARVEARFRALCEGNN
jgi:hypothetical protein